MKKINYFTLTSCLLLLATCCKDPETKPLNPVTYSYTLGDAKNYIWAKTGS